MIENGLWTGASTIQESGFVVNTTSWNGGGKGHRTLDHPSKKREELQLQKKIQFLIKVTSLEESGLLPVIVSLILKRFGKPYKYNTITKHWDKQAKDIVGTAQVAKVAAESLDTEPTAYIASFASVIQGGTKHAFNKFSYRLLGHI